MYYVLMSNIAIIYLAANYGIFMLIMLDCCYIGTLSCKCKYGVPVVTISTFGLTILAAVSQAPILIYNFCYVHNIT